MKRRLLSSDRGAAAIEMAFALPTLVIMIWMIVQLGMVFRAMSGIQHALGEGARYATIWPQPTDDQIEDKIENAVYGIGPGNFTINPPAPGLTPAGEAYLDLQVSYTQSTNLLLLPGPTITVSRSKRVWVAD
jgi:Flp pilus assembly protein TadG